MKINCSFFSELSLLQMVGHRIGLLIKAFCMLKNLKKEIHHLFKLMALFCFHLPLKYKKAYKELDI